jgi:hypothetical protein
MWYGTVLLAHLYPEYVQVIKEKGVFFKYAMIQKCDLLLSEKERCSQATPALNEVRSRSNVCTRTAI